MMMTACDVSAITKPWGIQQKVSAENMPLLSRGTTGLQTLNIYMYVQHKVCTHSSGVLKICLESNLVYSWRTNFWLDLFACLLD